MYFHSLWVWVPVSTFSNSWDCDLTDKRLITLPLHLYGSTRNIRQEAGLHGERTEAQRSLALAIAVCLHRRRHPERRWRPEGGFNRHQREAVVEQWDLDPRYRVQDQAWALVHLLEEWCPLRPLRTTCIAPRCPGLDTRWAISPSLAWPLEQSHLLVLCQRRLS